MRRDQAARVLSSFEGVLPLSLLALTVLNCPTSFGAVPPGLTIAAGNGQVTAQFFNTTVPLTVQAGDAAGNPVPNLSLTWSVSQGQGTVVSPPTKTDSNGIAGAFFNGNVTPGNSFSQATVTVSSSVGSVNFVVTTALNRLSNGSGAELPLVYLASPPIENRTLTGRSGTTLPGAVNVQVAVQSGPQTGAPVPNVGIRLIDNNNPDGTSPARCAGTPMSDASGTITCDVVLTGTPGQYSISAVVGEFRITPGILLNIQSAASCTYSASALSTQYPAAAAFGTITVNTQASCSWTAVSSVTWISITSGASGSGPGGTVFSVSPNTGPARSGIITAAGQNITINQSGTTPGGGQALAIVTGANLPPGVLNTTYNASLAASGGTAPYNWTTTVSFPPGLTLNPSTGAITGTPSQVGNYTLPVTVTDSAGSSQARTFTLSVVASGGQPLTDPTVTNTAFADAIVGRAYQAILTSIGGCTSPFSAPPVYTISSGSLPSGLSIVALDDRRYAISGTPTASGTSNFTVTVTDSCNHSGSSNFTLNVTGGTGPGTGSVTAAPASLSFNFATGASGNPPDQTVVLSGPAGTTFSATAAATAGGNWLTLSGATSGSLPASLTVHLNNPGSLGAGSFTGAVTVSTSAGNVTVPVTLTVSLPAAAVTVAPTVINYSAGVGDPAIQQPLTITNTSGPAHFTIQVTTVNGGPSWLTVNATSGDTPSFLTVTLNSAGLQPATYNGSIQILPTNPVGSPQTIPVTFRVTATAGFSITPTSLTFVSQPGAPPPATQNLTISSTGAAVDGLVAATTVSGGTWLFVEPLTGTTPFTVKVSVNAVGLQAGTYQGSIVVASGTQPIPAASIPVTLTISTGPVIAALVNAASFTAGPVSPGEIVTIFGSGIGPANLVTSRVTSQNTLDTFIGNTRVFFDDVAAPLIYTSAQQVSVIVPYSVANKANTRVSVEYLGISSPPMDFRVTAAAPALFTFNANGQGPVAALNQDNTYNSQPNGAEPGSVVVLFATGEGQTNPAGVDGLLATGSVLPKPQLPVTVTIGGQSAEVLYAGAAPTFAAGLMQINVRVPQNVQRNTAVPINVMIGQASSQANVVMYIK